VLWLDCDREGENIAYEVKGVCERVNRRLRVFRARFSALIPRDIVYAVQHLATPDEKLSLACDARSEIDLRIGAAFTRFQTMRIQRRFPGLTKEKGVISYGPCQFPTLGFVVERYLKIQTFEKEAFYHISVTHQQNDQPDAPVTTFKWKRDRVFDRMACLCIYESLVEHQVAEVESIDKRPASKRKPLPLTTVELQKRASRWLRISSEQTMKAAESLYNKGFISYPRTETNKFKEGTDLMALIRMHENHDQWGSYVSGQLLQGGKYEHPRAGGADDQAHPPIHPTKSTAVSSLNDPVEKKVYELVALHFLACCSKDARGSQTNVQMRMGYEKFTASGLMVEERNYLDIYKFEKWNASAIPVYQQGDTFEPTTLLMVTGEISPPPLLTEADLIAKMDSNGIGTDATIAEHIKTILKREYAIKVNNDTQFKPTTLGLALVLSYENMGLELAKPALRAAVRGACPIHSLFEPSSLTAVCVLVDGERLQSYCAGPERCQACDRDMHGAGEFGWSLSTCRIVV
jgi:DNA topoisomerase-3